MKNIFLITLTVILAISVNHLFAQDSAKESKSKFEKVSIKCSVKCNSCKEKIEKNIAFEKGVKDLLVDVETKTVTIKYNKEKTNPEQLEAALKKLDFETEIVKDCTGHAKPHDCKGVQKAEGTKCCTKKNVKCCSKKTVTKAETK